MAFVATSAPSGWKLGRWSQTSQKTWREEKLDGSNLVYDFDLVSGPSIPGSSTYRLSMKGQNTEVLLLESSAQVFVNGCYFGEYGGQWQAGGGGQKTGSKQSVAARAPSMQSNAAAPAPPVPARQGGSKAAPPQVATEDADFEQTLKAPPPQQQQKAAPPPRGGSKAQQAAAASPAPAPAAAPISQMMSTTVPEMPSRSQKAEGLDKSDKSMQLLIDAAKKGDVAKIKELLGSGIDPDGPAKDGRTPLMAAVGGGHRAAVEALLDASADPTLGKGEETPMTIAFQKGNQDILKILFSASFNTMNNLVGPKPYDIPEYGVRSGEEAPESAMDDLRDITSQIAKLNSGMDRPISPGGKYGNYSQLAGDIEADKDPEMLRTEAVKLAMKQLSKTNKEGGLGLPSPGR